MFKSIDITLKEGREGGRLGRVSSSEKEQPVVLLKIITIILIMSVVFWKQNQECFKQGLVIAMPSGRLRWGLRTGY
jgi:hypothetical protein